MTFTITYENQIEAENPLQAAKQMLKALRASEGECGLAFTVTDNEGNQFSVDLDEEDKDAVLKIN